MPDQVILTAALQAAATEKGKGQRVRIVAYGGGIMRVPGWGPCVIELAGLTLPATVTLLADHENRVGAVVGAGIPVIEGGQLVISGRIANTDAGREVVALLSGGVSLQASVGVNPGVTQYVRPGEQITANGRTHEAPAEGMVYVAKGSLKEVSITPIGADGDTTVSLAARRAAQNRGARMDFHEWMRSNGFDPAGVSDSQREALLRMYQSEQAMLQARAEGASEVDVIMQPARIMQQRRDDLRRAIERASANHPDRLTLIEATGRAAMAEGWSAEKFDLELLRGMSSHAGIDTRPRSSGGPVSAEVLQCAMLLHAGMAKAAEKEHGAQVCQRAADLRIRSVLDWCEHALQARGVPIPRGREELVKAASLTAAGPSSYHLPVALGNVAEKALLESYGAVTKSWMSWCHRQPVRNFKAHSTLRALTTRGLQRVHPGGELKHGTVGEDVYIHQAETFGELIVIDRRDIINDDLGALLSIPRELGLEAARSLADVIYETLLANGDNFFSVGNGNFDDGADSVLAMSSLEAAIALFRKQVDLAGRVLDVPPRVLLVPPELEFTARRLIGSAMLTRDQEDDLQPMGNPLQDMLRVETEARLSNEKFTGASATAWYLFSDPGVLPVGIVSFLDGVEAPKIENVDVPANHLGAAWRCVYDFGFHLADHRAGVLFAGDGGGE